MRYGCRPLSDDELENIKKEDLLPAIRDLYYSYACAPERLDYLQSSFAYHF